MLKVIELFAGVGNNGDILDVYLLGDGEYDFGQFDNNGFWVETPNTLYLTTAPMSGEKITVYQFSNHDVAKIERINLATSATVEGQTTAYYIQDSLKNTNAKVTKLAQGLPVGGEIESLDDGTLYSAFKNRTGIKTNSD